MRFIQRLLQIAGTKIDTQHSLIQSDIDKFCSKAAKEKKLKNLVTE